MQEVLNIEQMMLLENYTEFISKVKQEPKASVEEAKKWLLGDLLTQDFQVWLSESLCSRKLILPWGLDKWNTSCAGSSVPLTLKSHF